jgi:Protein of unknown function (DUF2673)
MKIDFEFDSTYGVFRDSLHLPDDHTFTDTEISTMKQQRFDNWIAIVTAPSPNYVLDADGNMVLDENGNPIIQE